MSDQDENEMNKRQGGYNVVKPDMKCEIECVYELRNPKAGQGLSIKDAAKACQNICVNANKQKRIIQRERQPDQKSLRELIDDDTSNTNEK
jgi:hypothetical protein